mgnify:CR=1 FL=1
MLGRKSNDRSIALRLKIDCHNSKLIILSIFKGKGRYDSITYPQSGFGLDSGKLHLSKIGDIKIRLHRPSKEKSRPAPLEGCLRENGLPVSLLIMAMFNSLPGRMVQLWELM